MRTICVCAFTALAFVFAACQKGETGPQGPQGQTGPQGSQGLQGNTGSANVIYSDWISFSLADWKDTIMTNIPRAQRALKSASALTQAVMDSGVIMVYLKDVTNNIYQLPLTYNVNPARVHNFIPTPGKFVFYEYAIDGSGAVANPSNKYRYIIIPGGVKTNGRSMNWKAMTYDQVCDLLEIQK